MKVITSASDLEMSHRRRVGFVPTMGALHEGHLALIRRAKEVTGFCVVSIFVNPTQFGPSEDFSRYPRTFADDAAKAEEAGADVIYAPEVSDIYGEDRVWVRVEGVSSRWEGEWRPGHFEGVATVVAKLFMIVQPSDVFFGMKDLQQCAVIQALIRGLKFPIEMHVEPTVREADGLALSSRNRFLSDTDRATAAVLPQTLRQGLLSIANGAPVPRVLADSESRLVDAGFEVQYVAYVDPDSMEPLTEKDSLGRMIVAAKLGQTRLIDNLGHYDTF